MHRRVKALLWALVLLFCVDAVAEYITLPGVIFMCTFFAALLRKLRYVKAISLFLLYPNWYIFFYVNAYRKPNCTYILYR